MKPFLLLLATAVAGFTAHSQVLATAGSSKISTEEFNRRLEEIRRQAMNPPTPEQFLEDLVRYKIGVQEAEKRNLTKDPLVKERMDQVLYNSLLELELGGKVEAIQVTEPEMKEFYKKNPELRIAHILIDLKPDASAEMRSATRKRALEILDKIKKSKRPFEELVKLYSDDFPTKEMGGDIGYQSRVTVLPAVYDTASKMTVGEVKGLVESKSGFHIIKLLDRRVYDLADKRQIRSAVFDEKRAKLFDAYFEKLKKQYKVEINKAALKAQKG